MLTIVQPFAVLFGRFYRYLWDNYVLYTKQKAPQFWAALLIKQKIIAKNLP